MTTKTNGKAQASPAPELTDEERQEKKRARWRKYYADNKAKYAEWGRRWREGRKAASPPPKSAEKEAEPTPKAKRSHHKKAAPKKA